jgi:hypothetical protein
MSAANARIRERWRSPVRIESLEPFGITDIGSRDRPVQRIPNRRWRRDANRRSALQRWNGIDRPPEPPQSLSPVEAAETVWGESWHILATVASEEHRPGIFRPRREQQNSLPALRDPERAGIDNAVRPREAKVFELVDEVSHGPAAFELQHERDILKQQPAWTSFFGAQPFEHFTNEARLLARDSGGRASLAEVLAGESRGDEVDFRERAAQPTDVALERRLEVVLEDLPRSRIDFAEKFVTMAGEF